MGLGRPRGGVAPRGEREVNVGICQKHGLPLYEAHDPCALELYDEVIVMVGCDWCFYLRADEI